MKSQLATTVILVASLCTALDGRAQSTATQPQPQAKKETPVTLHAKGPFDVKISPQADADLPQGVLSRMGIDKQFHGDLEAVSKGEMLAAGNPSKGSAGYVALEQVTGTLNGKKGSFVLQHSATIDHGVPHLSVTVVPESGTDQLTGLSGSMNIIITAGKHSYDFEYTLPEGH
jgi:hypothetical protein